MTKSIDELINEERREYFKKWRSENRDKVKKHNARFWEKRANQKLKFQMNYKGKDGNKHDTFENN